MFEVWEFQECLFEKEDEEEEEGMGCVASRIDKEERVRIYGERKRLMKQLLRYRKEFSDAQVAYLRSLRNTGITLRQFTESESLEPEDMAPIPNPGFPPSPPPPLPPSPPPPPTFSPDSHRQNESHSSADETTEFDEGSSGSTPPPSPVPNSSWEYWDVFGSALPPCDRHVDTRVDDDENWKDANAEFLEDDGKSSDLEADGRASLGPARGRAGAVLVDDSSSVVSSSDMPMVVWRGRRKKSLAGVVKDLDEHFLKASAVVKDIAVFIDIEAGGTFVYQSLKENKRKRSNPTKVLSALSWSWSSRSLQSPKEIGALHGSNDPCRPGAHAITLLKLYSEEQKLYKAVKEEEMAKVESGRKLVLLQRLEEEHDWAKAEKTRLAHETLKSYILSLQELIGKSSSTILALITEELHPQLIALTSGLMHMWRTMHDCHERQSHISQPLNHLNDQQKVEPTTESHRQAAAQLQTEADSWYNSFCKLVKFQREYVRVLCKWSELTRYLQAIDSPQGGGGGLSTAIDSLAKRWLRALDALPDKLVSEAIKGLLSAVHTIAVQQHAECSMRKRSERLARKLERETALLSEVEARFSSEDPTSVLTSNHPLTVRRAKVEALGILVDGEKFKYMSCVKTTRVMVESSLQTRLPKVFQALTVFSSVYAHSFEEIVGSAAMSEREDTQQSPAP